MRGFNAPGRFDRSPASVRKTIQRETSEPGASFGFGTELQNDARAAAAAAGAKGWAFTRFGGGKGRGECAILTKTSARTVTTKGLLQLTKGGGKGRLANPIYAPHVITTSTTSGRVTLFTTAHLPAHIETRWRAIPLPVRTKARLLAKHPGLSPVIATYLEALLSWKREVMALAAEHQVDDIVVGADWNLSEFAKWVRQFIEATWPGLNIVATKGPDLGKRNVGWLLTSMDGTGTVHGSSASDHRVGRFDLHHVNPPKTDPKPKTPPPPFSICTYSGVRMTHFLKTALQSEEKTRLKDLAPLTVYQGDMHPGVGASAGTHDKAGVVDLAPFEFGRKVKAWRTDLGPAWHRPEIRGLWGEHIHCIVESCTDLAPMAAQQVVQYHQGLDGLADHARDPNQFHPKVEWDYEKAWHEING